MRCRRCTARRGRAVISTRRPCARRHAGGWRNRSRCRPWATVCASRWPTCRPSRPPRRRKARRATASSTATAAPLAPADGEVVAMRHIEPAAGNAAALGVNSLSVAAAREAILATRRSGQPAATAAFRLTQSAAGETGIVIYQALYRGNPADSEAERDAGFRGVVFVTLRTEAALAALADEDHAYLHWCLIDGSAAAVRRRLAGDAGCERGGGQRPISTPFAGCSWAAATSSCRSAPPQRRSRPAARVRLAAVAERPGRGRDAGRAAAHRHRAQPPHRTGGAGRHGRAATRGGRTRAGRSRPARQRGALAQHLRTRARSA